MEDDKQFEEDYFIWNVCDAKTNTYILNLRVPAANVIEKIAKKVEVSPQVFQTPFGPTIAAKSDLVYEPFLVGIEGIGIAGRYKLIIQLGEAFREKEILQKILKELNLSTSFIIPDMSEESSHE